MRTFPSVQVALQHTSGRITAYRPGADCDRAEGGIKAAVITCASSTGGSDKRVELLRSDLPGADWTSLERAGAFGELQARLREAARDLADGHGPSVVVSLNADDTLGEATLITKASEVQQLLRQDDKRALAVPRILPYQLGGCASGATALLYRPTRGCGVRLHSLHTTDEDARYADACLKDEGHRLTGLLKVHTPVTRLLADIACGRFRPGPPAGARVSSLAHRRLSIEPVLSLLSAVTVRAA